MFQAACGLKIRNSVPHHVSIHTIKNSSPAMYVHGFVPAKTCCMVMRLNLDCNACCRKARKIILKMKEIETHMIEKQQCRIVVCGRFRAADVAIKLRKKMNRRVEILEIQEFGAGNDNEEEAGQAQPEHAGAAGEPT